MFFNHDHPFEELFCICLVVVNKTWKEMRATVEDFAKVFSVVREQITRVLAGRPPSQEIFKERIAALTYAEITDLWQQERTSREKWESRSRPIMELRQQIEPEILELIQQQRLGFLTEGTRFSKYTNRGVIKKCSITQFINKIKSIIGRGSRTSFGTFACRLITESCITAIAMKRAFRH
jgi:engulfment/cell motility protein 1